MDRKHVDVVYAFNQELLAEIIYYYGNLPILIAGHTAADILGWASTYGRWQYIGDKKHENDDLICLDEYPHSRDRTAFKNRSNSSLKIMDNISTLCSLVTHVESDWGLSALREVLAYSKDFWWAREIVTRGIQDRLFEKLEEAAELGITDKIFNERIRLYIECAADKKRFVELTSKEGRKMWPVQNLSLKDFPTSSKQQIPTE
jgi:hypothetical protein